MQGLPVSWKAFVRPAQRMKSNPPPDRHRRAVLGLVAGSALLGGCSVSGTSPGAHPRRAMLHEQLIKTDFDHAVEAAQRRIFLSLRRLAEKLYRRNPSEWRKGGSATLEDALVQIFDFDHRWHIEKLGFRRDLDILLAAFEPDYEDDRIMAFSVGLASMIQTAFGNRVGFYLLNELEPQAFYNAARNVEIAAWKLASTRNPDGTPLLLSNEMGEVTNLSFEREIGRIIGLLETLTDLVETKTERMVVRIVQNLATAVFLPIP
jgi:hypothetical protein